MKVRKIPIPEGKEKSLHQRVGFQEALIRATGKPYKLIETRTTTEIRVPGETPVKYFMRGLQSAELHFLAKVKKHFRRLENESRPVYIRPYGTCCYYNQNDSNLKPGEYSDVCEIDVSSAYWHQAKKLGYLTEELFREGNDKSKIRKKVRLMALGSLAKRTTVKSFEPPYDDFDIEIIEEDTAVFWDNITYTFGLEMQECFSFFNGLVLGYWVDAIFVKNAAAIPVKQWFQGRGYGVTVEPLKKVVIESVDGRKMRIVRITADGKKKDLPPFDPKNQKVKSFKAVKERILAALDNYERV